MKKELSLLLLVILLFGTSCSVVQKNTALKDDGIIDIVFVQVNDVYEIAPLAGGKEGGIARVASLKKEEKAKNENTFLVMGGDFVSPSIYNSLKYEGKSIRGKQMVEALNAAEMDFVVFGNHEFDIKESELQSRIDESRFTWVSSNTFHKTGDAVQPFFKNSTTAFPETYILNVSDADGTQAKIGIIGLTLPFNKASYVHYTDPMSTAKNLYNQLKDSVDVVVALTHLDLEDDIKLAQQIPTLGLIMGGHEHDMQFEKVGDVYITKAHANAKSAYVNTMRLNKNTGELKVSPKLRYINEDIPLDPHTNTVVEKWEGIANANYSSLGFDATDIVIEKSEPLEGREIIIRSEPSNLTELVVNAVQVAAPLADVVLVNAGAIRVDDILYAPVSQYDILRAMPFGGEIREVDMKGSLLKEILGVGESNKGSGGYLLRNSTIKKIDNKWGVGEDHIENGKVYRVAMLGFLLTGMETNLDFLKDNHPDIIKVYPIETSIDHPQSDIRLALVQYLKSLQN
ncbi:bifunctional metallophosphatase/5'-nucleotidase [Gelidibacter maritimus]|uniref:5'-nucleotidase C-terminal domain-containing protein n=1 Tax=Gelidibacter maritimus TaxID=2761487 RepID=A0A7W2M4U2_9FLAO|nr:5'-nucleotidase C-terminal domain-containing protein [Gelidibacter maritimus]MBA6152737.1 5'-nucleotidase C-terminal domain-containing protein [Gelidibacter maritimus]